MLKKLIALLLAALMVLFMVSGCGTKGTSPDPSKLKIVATIFPAHDWVENILGEKAADAELTLLLDDGVDMHSYQPTTDDIIKISTCDIFIYVGGTSDLWVKDALKTATNKNMVVINLLDTLGEAVKEEELKEGMTHGNIDKHEEENDHELDEHVWLSLKNAQTFCSLIAQKLGEYDAANAAAYTKNAADYINALNALDGQYQQAVDTAMNKTLLFGDRFPFRYLVDNYGLDYYAAFPGCSAETEASFETIIFLANKMNELSLKNVMVIDGSKQSIATTIIKNTTTKDQSILVLDSLQSVSSADIAGGATYLSIMEKNLTILKAALQ
ncbi:metal ABC transporter substrate-binding protein [Clostridia bacterium OttesenSCG-928-F22]|nr:metal ABC transporter substrate-binding protein [Clostridia bacterium OttesenSCG-928-F22]